MMKNIDDIFKNNLDSHGLDYKETYWEGMEDLLDKETKKKSFFNWRYIAAFFLGVGVCLIGLLLLPKQAIQRPVAQQVENKQQILESGNLQAKDSSYLIKTTTSNVSNSSSNISLPIDQNSETRIINPLVKSSSLNILPPQVINNESKITLEDAKQSNVVSTTQFVESPAIEPLEKMVMKTWVIMQFSKSELEQILPLSCTNCALKAAIKNTTVLDTNKSKKNQHWAYYMALSSEYNWYKRAANFNSLKMDEQTLNRFGYNLNIIAKKKSWGIKTGIGFMQLAELTNYKSIQKSNSIDTVYRLVNPNYGVSPAGYSISLIKKQFDTSTTTSYIITNPNAQVQWTYLKVPLVASYEWRINRLSVYLEGGINTAFRIKQRGTYTKYENGRYRLAEDGIKNDSKALLFQAYTGIGVKYRITSSIHLTGGFGLSKGLSSMMGSYTQIPNTNSINLGLEISL